MLRNKGEISTKMIVLILIGIASFVVLLIFLFRLDIGGESDIQMCRNSVIIKATASLSRETVPLKCPRKYVCITKNGDCAGMIKPKRINVRSDYEIYEALAEEMVDCWYMFGEGEYDYIQNDLLKKNYCSICSQILFDESLSKIYGINKTISKDEFYNYLATHLVSGRDVTYAEYILGTRDIDGLKQEISRSKDNPEGISSFGEIEIGKQYFLVMGITSGTSTFKWVLVATATVPLTIFSGGIAGIELAAGAMLISGHTSPHIGAIIVEGKGIKNEFMAPTIVEADPEQFEELKCGEVLTFS